MQVRYLIDMANDIGAFFASEPDTATAARGVAAHLRRSWEPRMRREIVEHCAAGGAGLTEPARAGVALLAQNS